MRESTESWRAVLRSLQARGLPSPRLTIADGHLGIWGALAEIYPASAEQRCWNHKLLNVLDPLPRRIQPQARALLSQLPYAETRAECERLKRQFVARYGRAYPKAAESLERDWERMVTFYRFPREHWKHLRTTNVVESPFAAVRLRTDAAKRYKRVANATALIWTVLMVAQSRFRRLDARSCSPRSTTASATSTAVASPERIPGGSPPDPIYTPLDMSSPIAAFHNRRDTLDRQVDARVGHSILLLLYRTSNPFQVLSQRIRRISVTCFKVLGESKLCSKSRAGSNCLCLSMLSGPDALGGREDSASFR